MYDNYGKYNHLSTILPDTFSIPTSESDVSSPAMAQQAPDRNSAFQFGIIPPVSTNGLKMREFTNGVSVNMLLGLSENERYLTVSGAGSIVSGQADGLQLSGLFNWTEGGSGLMASSCFNVTRGTFTGLQIVGLVNVADKVRGVQLSTLVNVAQECDFPIGLINIIKNGEMGVAVTCDALGNAMVSFRSGGKYTYGIIGAGYNFLTLTMRHPTRVNLVQVLPTMA